MERGKREGGRGERSERERTRGRGRERERGKERLGDTSVYNLETERPSPLSMIEVLNGTFPLHLTRRVKDPFPHFMALSAIQSLSLLSFLVGRAGDA